MCTQVQTESPCHSKAPRKRPALRGSRTALTCAQVFRIQDLPTGILLDVLVLAGAWTEGQPRLDPWRLNPGPPIYSALSVCRDFREVLMDSPSHMVALLTGVHGSRETALVRACKIGNEAAAKYLLQLPERAPRADHGSGLALVTAAEMGHENIVRLLLEFPKHAPRGDASGGLAKQRARAGGHVSILQLLEAPVRKR
ncbi:hypothetical protein FOA52_006048 [Chlamydomonas sp. UWO 241]|nr:hypothetical protein FOA52_006048 [Chlamydomonas sp. UWO 241]